VAYAYHPAERRDDDDDGPTLSAYLERTLPQVRQQQVQQSSVNRSLGSKEGARVGSSAFADKNKRRSVGEMNQAQSGASPFRTLTKFNGRPQESPYESSAFAPQAM